MRASITGSPDAPAGYFSAHDLLTSLPENRGWAQETVATTSGATAPTCRAAPLRARILHPDAEAGLNGSRLSRAGEGRGGRGVPRDGSRSGRPAHRQPP